MFAISNKYLDRLHFLDTEEDFNNKFYKDNNEKDTFLRIPTKIMNDSQLNSNDKVTLSKIIELSQQKGYCYASNSRLSEYLGLSARTITDVLKRLDDFKYIDRSVSFKDGNISTKKRRIYINKVILRVYKDTNKKGNKKTSTEADPFDSPKVDENNLPF